MIAMAKAKEPTPDAEKKWRAYSAFAKELARCAGEFEWEVDRHGQIRASSPDCVHRLCPITAVEFSKTKRYRPVTEGHAVLDEIGMGAYGLEVYAAIDNERKCRLRDLLLETIGLTPKAKT